MKDTARVIITTECNLHCSYCCNKIKEVQKRFKFVTVDELCETKYKNYCITGGEPLLAMDKLVNILKKLKQRFTFVYLYTNGTLISEDVIKRLQFLVNGINIGVHFDNGCCSLPEYKRIYICNLCRAYGMEVRFSVDKRYRKLLGSLLTPKTWEKNKCLNNIKTEDWLIC